MPRPARAAQPTPFDHSRVLRTAPLRYERQAWRDGFRWVAGTDEAGRGPLAGPVVAAALIWPQAIRAPWLAYVTDSKLLTPDQRAWLAPRIMDRAVAWAIAVVDTPRVDAINILQASKEAMAAALAALDPAPDLVILDALVLPGIEAPQLGLIRGDRRSSTVAAASILAKVTRDRLMCEAADLWPGYGFEHHKGYAAPQHVAALRELGPCPIHRRSFEPVRLALEGRLARDWFDPAWAGIDDDAAVAAG